MSKIKFVAKQIRYRRVSKIYGYCEVIEKINAFFGIFSSQFVCVCVCVFE